MELIRVDCDVLIIGGGTAGCYAAYTLAKKSDLKIVIAEKANIKRSGCLAAGVNAINAYITKGHQPSDYADYAVEDAEGIARYDLLLSMSERLNEVTAELERLGLVILKDENGEYITRGDRNIKINGENLKVILSDAVKAEKQITVINHINITDYIVKDNHIYGAYGFDVNEKKAYAIHAAGVICATGGAAGIYRPNNPGFSRHKLWYPPFNTGAGYAMGMNAGAEMTTFEMRFIALRCKDTIAPTGTIAQGVRAKQTNSHGEVYETKYGIKTSERLYGTMMENRAGRGPCYLDTTSITDEQEQELYKAYLNMAPSQTLRWLETGRGPKSKPVEVTGTEPYIVGGHTASGYWIDNRRRTTVKGLYAAGDVAGGTPQKYVTGALAEGAIAAETLLSDKRDGIISRDGIRTDEGEKKLTEYESFFRNEKTEITIDQLESAMQKIMDEYAGGITTDYLFNKKGLKIAEEGIRELMAFLPKLKAEDMDDLLRIYEIRERLTVSLAVIAHLGGRHETRWHSFAENADYRSTSDDWLLYVNSVMRDGRVELLTRDLVRKGDDEIDFVRGGQI
ncbi:MAG: adenylyl-sulfate reductase subunit alpha [Eubacterium sp.]|nr:adenylyl-sulfate reductase subunit alpha [Eubacterium sp.]